jgi:hypothetical protein
MQAARNCSTRLCNILLNFWSSKGIVAQRLTKYDKPDISSQDLLKMMSVLSDNVFNVSTESRAQSSRNMIINILIYDWDQRLVTPRVALKSAYDVEDFNTHLSVDFVSEYVDGKLQLGVSERWYAVKQDNKHYVVVSSVEGES